MKAVIFDIDGTLSPGLSWIDLTRDLGADVGAHQKIFADYTAKTIDYPESKRQLLGLWQATGNANRPFITRIFKKWPLRQSAPAVIRTATNLGYRPCLITGSVDLYASVIADRLHVADWFANTPLIFDDQGQLIDYQYERDQAGKKLRQLEYFCTKYRLEPTECLAVGDSDNDIGLFHATRHGILLEAEDQSPELHDAAWQSVERLAEVAQVFPRGNGIS